MDWNDLRYFLAVVRAGSLAGAARALGVEHTTVSRRLAALEADLGAKLFSRGPAGLSLTASGEEIVTDVEDIGGRIEALSHRVAGRDQKVAGTVRVTMPDSGNTYFAQHLLSLRERHPELVIEILTDNRALDLRRGEADIALRFRDNPDPDLVGKKVGVAGWSLYASRGYVERKGALASVDDLSQHEVIGFDASLAGVTGAVWLSSRSANVVMRGNNIGAVKEAAVAGLGVAPLPCFTAAGEPSLVRLTPELIGTRDILLLVHPDLVKVARVRAVMDFLTELFARDRALWSGA